MDEDITVNKVSAVSVFKELQIGWEYKTILNFP